MAEHERKTKDADRRGRANESRNEQALQRGSGRAESLLRDPFSSFWDQFGLATRNAWPFQGGRELGQNLWSPQIETFQRGSEFVVRADLPGLNKDDVKIDITDDTLTIEGERHEEHEEDREGYYRSERSYGSFCRVVPLPEGAITDSAKAQFNNGVLEIVVQAPPREVSRGRRVEIAEAGEAGRAGNRNQNRNENEKERAETQR